MHYLRHLLEKKGREIWSVAPDSSVFDALKLMAEKGVGALLVLDGGKLCGIISERDYARKVALLGKTSVKTPVREIMTRRVVCVPLERTVEECMALMTDKHIRHLPVLDKGELVGLVSIGDVVKATVEEKEWTIRQLEEYISS